MVLWGCNPALLQRMPTASSEEGGFLPWEVVMFGPSKVLTIHSLAGCPTQRVTPYLLALLKLA